MIHVVFCTVETDDATRQANNCSSANSGTSITGVSTSLIELPTPLQSSITPLESAQSLSPQSAHQPILDAFPKCTYGK